MKPLHRVHRVSIGYLHERLANGMFSIEYEDTNKMAADAYSKGFTDATKWRSLLPLIGICHPEDPGSMPTTEIVSLSSYEPKEEPRMSTTITVTGGGKPVVAGGKPVAGQVVHPNTPKAEGEDQAKSDPTDHSVIQPATPIRGDSRRVLGPSVTQIELQQRSSSSTTTNSKETNNSPEGRLNTDKCISCNAAITTTGLGGPNDLKVPVTHVSGIKSNKTHLSAPSTSATMRIPVRKPGTSFCKTAGGRTLLRSRILHDLHAQTGEGSPIVR